MEIDITRKLRPGPLPGAASSSEDAANAVSGKSSQIEADPVTGWLIVMKGLGYGRSFSLGYGTHSVGRAEDQRISIRFGDRRISRRSHVEVTYEGKDRRFYVSPGRAGSNAGFLNGELLHQRSPLQEGDRIRIGDTELGFIPFCGEIFDWRHT